MEKLINIVKELLRHNIDIWIDYDKETDEIIYVVNGFYKSGTVKLKITEGEIIAESRYDQIDVIEDLEDFVKLNYRWGKIRVIDTMVGKIRILDGFHC
jgi:maltose-binding protein MalE